MSQWLNRTQPQLLPRGKHIVRFLASRAEFAGVGMATAQRMWDTFGEDLYQVLGDGEVSRLAEILPRTQAEIICDAWRSQRAVTDAVVFFDEHGISGDVARKAVDFWGEEAVARIRENPYRLLTICPWKRVDRAATLLGFAPDNPDRLIAAVEAALYERLDEKHTVTTKRQVLQRAGQLLNVSPKTAELALEAAVEASAAIPYSDGFQPAGAAYAERYIENRLLATIEATERQKDLLVNEISPEAIEIFLVRYNGCAAHPLTEEQADAVRMVMKHRLSILTGGAGVGKTTTLRAINEAAGQFGFQVCQLALAGRAAQRMSNATGRPAQTIAKWLASARQGQIETNSRTLLVVDEASMLDLPTLYRVLWHLHEDARLLLVGDVAQLPPIGYGLTLHRLVLSPRIPQVELTRVLRAGEATGIPYVSRAIRKGQVPHVPKYETRKLGCSFVTCGQDEIISHIERIRDDLRAEEVQVIAATYVGSGGIDAINQHFHRYNAHGKPRLRRFTVGDPVIWLENDYQRSLWNGSMGSIVTVDEHRLTACLDGQPFNLHQEEIAGRLDLAYAISTHKAQGSQWRNVIIPITPSRLMDRALIYTAVTRAQQRVVLVGNWTMFERTVSRPPPSLARDVSLTI